MPGRQAAAGAERKAMIALAAVFALLVQALAPAAHTAPSPLDSGQVICGVAGHAAPEGPTGPGSGHDSPCCDRACMAPTLVSPPPLAAAAVAYGLSANLSRPGADEALPAGVPPRPAGQGPPVADS